jgi:hypothetical protein
MEDCDMLRGTIIDMGSGHYGFEYRTTLYNDPVEVRQVWILDRVWTAGMSWADPKSAFGKPASLHYGVMSCYLGNGNYLSGEIAPDKPADICESLPVPRPKCRIETRWHYGRWEKLLRRGWVAA